MIGVRGGPMRGRILGLAPSFPMVEGMGALSSLNRVGEGLGRGQRISREAIWASEEAHAALAIREEPTVKLAVNRPLYHAVPAARALQEASAAKRQVLLARARMLVAPATRSVARPAAAGIGPGARGWWEWPSPSGLGAASGCRGCPGSGGLGDAGPGLQEQAQLRRQAAMISGFGSYTIESTGDVYHFAKDQDLSSLDRDPGPPTRIPAAAPPEGRWMKDLSLGRAEYMAFKIWRFATQAREDFGEQVDRFKQTFPWDNPKARARRAGADKRLADLDAMVKSLVGKQRYVLKKTDALYAAGYGSLDPATDYIAGALNDAFKEQVRLAGLWNESVQDLYGQATEEARKTTALMDGLGLNHMAQFLSDVADLPGKVLDAARAAAEGAGRTLDVLGWIVKWGLPILGVAAVGGIGYVAYRRFRQAARLAAG